MIPKIIHYCWFGRGEMPEVAVKCVESWHRFMPDWEFMLWNEENFDVESVPYTKEAYAAKKFAFVSDYVRLLVLEKEGGLYLDTDVEVYKPFDDLLGYHAFAGFEGSKHMPVGTCVMASEAHGEWISEQLKAYDGRRFIRPDSSLDLTTNVQFVSSIMSKNGFVQNGREQDYLDLHVFPVDYFCPRQTTGEFVKTENTYSNHLGIGSWNESKSKFAWLGFIGQKNMTRLIKLKRRVFG